MRRTAVLVLTVTALLAGGCTLPESMKGPTTTTSSTLPAINEPRRVRVPGEYEVVITRCGEDDTGHSEDPGGPTQQFWVEGTLTNLSDLRRDYYFHIDLTESETGVRAGYVGADTDGIYVDRGETVEWLGLTTGPELETFKFVRDYLPGLKSLECSWGEMVFDTPANDFLQDD